MKRSAERPRAVAQIAETYIVVDAGELGLMLVDQHAVHEKLKYIEFRRKREQQAVQELLVPYTYEAGASERAIMEALAPMLTEEGFETDHFGGGTFVIQSVPVAFEGLNVERFLRELVSEVDRADLKQQMERLRHRIGAMAACRSAIKAGDRLGMSQMQSLIDRMLENNEALRCPHGRPTMLLLTREQLDRQFGRLG